MIGGVSLLTSRPALRADAGARAAGARQCALGSAAREERDRGVRERGARRRTTAAEAHEALGRIYTFKGWQQESVFPGWHDEPASASARSPS